jgi:hypothetical protein
MISFERKGVDSSSAKSSTQVALRNQTKKFQPRVILSRSRCNLCEDIHDEGTCKIIKNAREHIFGKNLILQLLL